MTKKDKNNNLVECPECGKEVSSQGLGGHMFIMHQKKGRQTREALKQEVALLKARIKELEKENKKLNLDLAKGIEGIKKLVEQVVAMKDSKKK